MFHKISIVTVVFNSVDSIEKTIFSVVSQNYNNIEYLIIDGGSTDGTLDILEKYKKNIQVMIVEPDLGIYDAMNKSFSLATGEFLIFINAGDTFYSSDLVQNFCNSKLDIKTVYYGDAIIIDNNMEVGRYGGKFSKKRITHENICHQAIFYPKILYKSMQFDLRYKVLSDWIFNIKAFGKFEFAYLNYEVSNYELKGFSYRKPDWVAMKEVSRIICEYLGVSYWLYFEVRKNSISVFKFLGIFKFVKNKILRNKTKIYDISKTFCGNI